VFLTSVLDGGELSASRPRPFTSEERAPGLEAVAKRKIPALVIVYDYYGDCLPKPWSQSAPYLF